ncbi:MULTISPECIES: porin family protein [Chryseobacterium]|uniref:porin family protein n=1 Tax=Chryseobacterium TaxID=59732 RepID=UPI001629A8AC|nr:MULTISPECIES: porin family protein [Chryseobacterium]MDM1553879.1 outer membrane beta-barrel protein [Chryseobacterium indologenes]
MNNEWLNNLRSRMENHEEEVPEGLWDDISDELFSGEEENKLMTGFTPTIEGENEENEEKKIEAGNRSWFYRIGRVAAAAVLIFMITKIIPEQNQNIHSNNLPDSNKNNERENTNLPLNNAEKEESRRIWENSKADILIAQNDVTTRHSFVKNIEYTNPEKAGRDEVGNKENIQVITKTPGFLEIVPTHAENKPEHEIKHEKVEKEVYTLEKELSEKYADHAKTKNVKSRSEKKWMLSILTGNASSNSAEQQFHGYASVSGKPMSFEQVWSASEYVDDPLTQILLANQNKPVEARIRHKVPVTFGLSVYYNLGKRWGIGTGLNYTKLTSELHSGSDDNYIKGEQKVHYIGIPVQVNYNVIQKGGFTGYITGGALLEKPISGNITTSYVVHDEVKETSTEALDHKPLSFSVNTAVGVQVKVVNRLGIYAEPGIGYHFKDENSPNTIYKEKPLHFNVKFGIRLLID